MEKTQTQKAAAILNQIAALLNTADKNMVISIAIKGMVEQGATVEQAYEAIFGFGSYSKMKDMIWESLQKTA